MKVLIVGGAGYIGSHCVLESLRAGHEVVVLDDLRTGHRESIADVELVEGSLHQQNVLRSVLKPINSMRFSISPLPAVFRNRFIIRPSITTTIWRRL